MVSQKQLKTGIVLAFALETISVTYGLKIPGCAPLFSILYLIAGICIALILLFLPKFELPGFSKERSRKKSNFFRIVGSAILVTVGFCLAKPWLDNTPIEIAYADMLPIIKVMNQRLLGGHWKQVYDIIPVRGGTLPIYLPALWTPFILSVFFHFDMRWISVAGLLISFCFLLWMPSPKKNRIRIVLVWVAALVLFCWLFTDEMPNLIPMTEEGVVVAYYSILVLALLSENIVIIALAACFCLFSRYALIGWIPAFLLYLVWKKKIKQVWIFTAMGVGFLALFIVSFGWTPILRMVQLPAHYVAFAKKVWTNNPEFFTASLGFAKFFGPGKISQLHSSLIILTFTVPVLLTLCCFYLNRKREIHNIPLASLKISVVIFYNFIDAPYLYLFYTSSFISLLLLAVLPERPAAANSSTEKAFL